MKKNFRFAFVGAIALLGAVGISSCSSSSDEVINNPDYDPTTNSVKTEFALNITHPGNRTRMSSANTQSDGTFQGMSNMCLFSIHGTPGTDAFLTSGSFDLGSLAASDISSTQSSKVYTMSIPVTTDHFLFYGKNGISSATPAEKGSLTYNVSKTSAGTSAITFNLNPIVAADDVATKVTTPETTLAGYLNTIENTTDWAGTVTTAASDANYTGLANAYKTFTSLTVRQGSSVSILRQVQDIYRVVSGISTSTPSPAVKTIADAIIANITGGGFTVTSGTGENAVLGFSSSDAKVTNFPEEAGLPAGSAVVTFISTATAGSKFAYVDYTTSALFGGASPSTLMGNINTPAEIVYFDNSPIRVSTQSVAVTDFPKTSTDWETSTSWTAEKGWGGTEVASTTRAVAMQYNIKYGVALLEANVKLGATPLTDNRYAITNSAEADQTDIDGAKLKLTGIIIGGQPSSADWQFLPATGATINQTIYDPITATALSTSNITNYTLALDNYAATAATVNIVLEFLNDDKDFYGKDGLIAKGQKFYLVGALVPGTDVLTWPAGIPNSGTNRVFIQDFKTVANFTLDNGDTSTTPARKPSLQNAYSVIPDLRSTQMTFGLSVDLTWKAGLTFNVNL